MDNREAVNWLINISADIGKVEHSDLWHYEQALTEIKDMLESAQLSQEDATKDTTKDATSDLISRQAAIDEEIRCAMCRNQMKTDRGCDGNCRVDEKLHKKIIKIVEKHLSPAQPEHDAEFWRKRAKEYSDICFTLTAEMAKGIKFNSIHIDENGIAFGEEQPERKTGHWILYDKRFPWSKDYKCSECGNYINISDINAGRGSANFCPNCGADMRGGTE